MATLQNKFCTGKWYSCLNYEIMRCYPLPIAAHVKDLNFLYSSLINIVVLKLLH